MDRDAVLKLMKEIVHRQGNSTGFAEADLLQTIRFRSLDFSELALRVEMARGKQLDFDAATLRAIRTVRDVLDFMEQV